MSGRTAGTGSRRADAGVDKKAWASGRVLTSEQRQRKQEVDRKANRFLKKEVQDRLALLEARVLQLEHSPPSANKKYVAAGISPSVLASSASPVSAGADAREHSSLEIVHGAPYWVETTDFASASACDASGHHVDDVVTSRSLEHTFGHPQLNDTLSSDVKTTAGGRDLTIFLSQLVRHVRSIAPDRVCYDDEHNQDVVSTAVLKDWKYALSRYEQICPLWQVLQMVDLSLFKDCSIVERMSCLRMLHKRYMFETKNVSLQVEGPLPAWFKPQ